LITAGLPLNYLTENKKKNKRRHKRRKGPGVRVPRRGAQGADLFHGGAQERGCFYMRGGKEGGEPEGKRKKKCGRATKKGGPHTKTLPNPA